MENQMTETVSLEFVTIFRMQGENAFLNGAPVTRNPWLLGSEEHKAWCDGWIDESERSYSSSQGDDCLRRS
jgi:hypothetical protein